MKFDHLLHSQEGKTLEFKRDLSSPANIMKTLVAFANTAGGVMLIGVEDMKQGMSRIRNQVIARTFRELDLIEQWGTIFLAKPHRLATSSNDKAHGGVNKLFEFIQSNPGGKSVDFRVALNQSQRTIERWLKRLKDEEKIEFLGAPKTGGIFPNLTIVEYCVPGILYLRKRVCSL